MSGAYVQAKWDSVLEIAWFLCDEAQQVDACNDRKIVAWLLCDEAQLADACDDRKIVHWCEMQGSSQSSQGIVDSMVSEAGVNTAPPDTSAVFCC